MRSARSSLSFRSSRILPSLAFLAAVTLALVPAASVTGGLVGDAAAARVQEPAPERQVELLFEDGKSLRGEVVETTPDSLRFRYTARGKSVVRRFGADSLDPASFVEARVLDLGDDASEHIALAKYALAQDLYAKARLLYERARQLDPKLVEDFDRTELPRVLDGAAQRIVGRAKAALERGDFDAAESEASIVMTYFSTTSAVPEARQVLTDTLAARAETLRQREDRTSGGGRVLTVLLKTGRSMRARPISSTADAVTVEILGAGEAAETVIEADRLDPQSYYDLRRLTMEDGDLDAHIELARFAFVHQMFTRAKAQADRARSIDPDRAEERIAELLPLLRESLALDLLSQARLHHAEGDLRTAERKASTILTRFSDTLYADEAGSLVQEIRQKIAETAERELEARIAEYRTAGEEATAAEYEKRLAPVRALVREAEKENEQGRKGFRFTRAERDHEAAARTYGEAIDLLKALEEEHAQDARFVELSKNYRERMREGAVASLIDAGSVSLMNQQFDKASKFADKALAVDPNSTYAQEFRARVDASRDFPGRSGGR